MSVQDVSRPTKSPDKLDKGAVAASLLARRIGIPKETSAISWACIDYKTAAETDPVLGKRTRIMRHAGSVAGGGTDVTIATNSPGNSGITPGEKTHHVANRLAGHLANASAHYNCKDIQLTPDTVASMAMYDKDIFVLARAMAAPWLEMSEGDYLRALSGAARTVDNSHIGDPGQVHQELTFGVAKLREADGGEAVVVSGANCLYLPTSYLASGELAEMGLYIAQPGQTVPELYSAARADGIEVAERDVMVASITRLAWLAKTLELPVAVVRPDFSMQFL